MNLKKTAILSAIATIGLSLADTALATLPRLHAEGTRLVDPTGKPVDLKGCNLGNWLVIETWMLQWNTVPDQYTIVKTLRDRFGDEEGDRLMSVYRDNYITPRDFENIKRFGFNVVRLPFAWDMVQEETAPFAVRKDAFKYIDRAIQMASDAGVYVILDLHGTPGSQSKEHHTYREAQNKLWKNEENLNRTNEIWKELAARYKGNPTVVAYDLINEPFGDYKQDLRPDLVELTDRIYKTIRAEDPDTLIYLPGTLQGSIEHYGDPHAKGMKYVGFTEHFYAGLFGDKSVPSSHARLFNGKFVSRKAMLDKLATPYLIGEFNVVLEKSGGDPMMRKYFDTFIENGWIGTVWSYKLLKPEGGIGGNNWYLATNANDIPKIDVKTSSKEEIETWFKNLSTMPLAVDEPLLTALTTKTAPPVDFTTGTPVLPKTVPADPIPAGWTLTSIGTPETKAGLTVTSPKGLTIVAGGRDIWANEDSFAFLSRPATGDFDASATIVSLDESHEYAKAGLMLRMGTSANAAMAFLNVFPDGSVGFSERKTTSDDVKETKTDGGRFPIALRLVRKGNTLTAYSAHVTRRNPKPEWKQIGTLPVPAGETPLLGLAVCAHEDGLLTGAKFDDLSPVLQAGH